MPTPPRPLALAGLTDTAAPLELLNLRVPGPVVERLQAQADALNATRAAVVRHCLALGLEQLEQITAAAPDERP